MPRSLEVALFLGFKSIIRGNKATLALMVFIMSLAFVNLVFISSILYGIIAALNKQVATNVVSNIVIDPQEEPVRKDYIIHARALMDRLGAIPGVTATARHYKLAGAIAYDKEKNGKLKVVSGEIIGIDPGREKEISRISQNIVDGRYLEELDNDSILLGSAQAGGYGGDEEFRSLGGAKAGDKVVITFSNGAVREYKIKGVFKINFNLADRLAFITGREAESVLSVHDSASQILVRTDTLGSEDEYTGQIRSLAPDLRVRKWSDYMGGLSGVSTSFQIITLIISAIGLAVAAITIFILIYVNTVSRRRQIGILKAIGIEQNIVIYSYILQALFYASSGVIIGSVSVFYLIEPYFAAHPLPLPIGETRMVLDKMRIIYNIVSLMIAALIAGLIPSWRAAREDILKAIWGA